MLVIGGVALWWPAGSLPGTWLDRGDQLASMISMVLTLIGVVLAYLVWRPSAARRRRNLEPAPLAQGGGASRPRQLPVDTAWFTGRAVELEQLLAVIPGSGRGSAVVISAIDGMAGIGKTALAVHAAHRLADRYPDGQLFIDLHGYTGAVAPVEPADALERLLRALGVAGERIPVEVDDRAALWRSVLAEREILIVLDNAATEDQIEPLLPGAPGCLVLVTSRRRLATLPATHLMSLDTLPTTDAIRLFARTAGQEELATESREQVVEAVRLCGRLPLAIRIAAARLKHHHTWTVGDLVTRLRDQEQRLGELATGTRSVAVALELSYQQLGPDHRRMYRLLGLHPGLDIEVYAAAALADTTMTRAGRLLDDLLDAHLLIESAAGRYVFHDLVRDHAASTVVTAEPAPARTAAVHRLLDHYRNAAVVAMCAAYAAYGRCQPPVTPSALSIPGLSDPAQAITWLDTELPNLLAAARHAVGGGWPDHTWHLSATLHRHLRTRGRYRDAEALHTHVLTAAGTTSDHASELDALRGLGNIHWLQGRYEETLDHFGHPPQLAKEAGDLDVLRGDLGNIRWQQSRYKQAVDHFGQLLEVAREIGDSVGEVEALIGLGWVHLRQGRYEHPLNLFQRALATTTTTGDRVGEMDALLGLGWVHLRQSQYDQAIDYFGRVPEEARKIDYRPGEMDALLGLGWVHLRQDRYEQAVDQFGQVLKVARDIGHHGGELYALRGLGEAHRIQGLHEQAVDHYQQALNLAQEIGDRNWQLEALHSLAGLHQAAGRHDAALAYHHRTLALATALEQPVDQVRAHDGLARTHHALDRPEQASQHRQKALDILSRFGADQAGGRQANVPTVDGHPADLRSQPREATDDA